MARRLARFENAQGDTLKGVVVQPNGEANGPAIVYLPGIVLGATAVHGLAFKLGDRLAEAGCTTVVFDPPGVGESEGDYPTATHEEISDWVYDGSMIAPTTDIVDWVRTDLGIERIGLIGHCGGALTAAYCTADDPSVAGALLISPPPLKRTKGESEVERPEVADEYFKLYAQKIFSPTRWKRLFSGESDYRTLTSVIRTRMRQILSSDRPTEAGAKDDRFNPRLVESTRRALESGKRLSVVFGDRDIDMGNFRDFHELYLSDKVPLEVIEETSHGFTTPEGQSALMDASVRFAARLRDGS